MELGEQFFDLAPSQTRSTDTFASPQTTIGESVGYSFESERNSPLDDRDNHDDAAIPSYSPSSSSSSGSQHHHHHHTHVGNVVVVPRINGPSIPYTHTPAPHLQNSYFQQHHLQNNNNHHHPNHLYYPPPGGAPQQQQPQQQHHGGGGSGLASSGRRRIQLKLQEDIVKHQNVTKRGSFFFRKKSNQTYGKESSIAFGPVVEASAATTETASIDRGTITVSWYDGTPSLELQEHVRRMVIRKLGVDAGTMSATTSLHDMRILDESVDPPEEIVLSPFLPDGARFLLRFSTKDNNDQQHDQYHRRAGIMSPSPSSQDLAGLNATQLALLASRWDPSLNLPKTNHTMEKATSPTSIPTGILKNNSSAVPTQSSNNSNNNTTSTEGNAIESKAPPTLPKLYKRSTKKKVDKSQTATSSKYSVADTDDDNLSMHPEDLMEVKLKKMTELLLLDQRRQYTQRRQEKQQVIFVLANYIVLFLSLIAISAEIQARAPNWLAWLEREFANVQQCATDQDALFQCVSNGDFAGLVASVILWLSRSASTKRIFLFGFKSPKQLWAVVYEALVSGLCWGFSYLFIRRALKPEIRKNYFQNHWKDAVYGSLAVFNASFMKQVLKNLIPQERFEEALQQKQLNIFSWFPSLIQK